jgi:SAM-dependent methyltransferase
VAVFGAPPGIRRLPGGTITCVEGPTERTLAAYQANVEAYLVASPQAVNADVAVLLDELVDQAPGRTVLEIGTGPGHEADYLEARGLAVQRTDAVAAFVDRLVAAGHEARLLDVRSGDLEGPYDAVLALAVLHHLSRPALLAALTRIRDAARPQGVLALTMKEGDSEGWSTAKLGAPRWFVYWREADLREVLECAGWSVLRLDHVHGRNDEWLYALCRRDA